MVKSLSRHGRKLMNSIHIADQGHQQTYDEVEARRLWQEGAISRDSLYWQLGMTEWRPAAEFFATPPRSTSPEPSGPVISSPAPGSFAKDPTRLTRTLITMLWLYLALAGVAALHTIFSMATGQAGQPET